MKKIIILFTVLLLTGCGVGTTRNSKNNSQHHNIYMNTDSKCAGIKRVSKKYPRCMQLMHTLRVF